MNLIGQKYIQAIAEHDFGPTWPIVERNEEGDLIVVGVLTLDDPDNLHNQYIMADVAPDGKTLRFFSHACDVAIHYDNLNEQGVM